MNYLSHAHGSLFPLFPHAAYLFSGVCVAAFCVSHAERSSLLRLTILLVLAFVVHRLLLHFELTAFRFERLLGVLAFTLLLTLLSSPIKRVTEPWLTLCAQTLAIYYSHVWFLYGHGFGVRAWVYPGWAPLPSAGFALACVLAFAAFGYYWPNLKGYLAALNSRPSRGKGQGH
ncbi:MAG: hypothetical protein IPJ88_10290 [Myxococcales bacterium]|nr:MAG: hypothetical protein IPJ88_10290 [Myxococcales bacterium]